MALDPTVSENIHHKYNQAQNNWDIQSSSYSIFYHSRIFKMIYSLTLYFYIQISNIFEISLSHFDIQYNSLIHTWKLVFLTYIPLISIVETCQIQQQELPYEVIDWTCLYFDIRFNIYKSCCVRVKSSKYIF